MWQKRWDTGEKGRHVYRIQTTVKATRENGIGSGNRRQGTVLTRLMLGCCALNKTQEMNGKYRRTALMHINRITEHE